MFNRNAVDANQATLTGHRMTFVCPRCGRRSWNPVDLNEGYCGACHDWTGPRSQQGAGPTGTEIDDIRMVAELSMLEDLGAAEAVVLGPYQAYSVIAAVQLACRHPAMSDSMGRVLADAVSALSAVFDDQVRALIVRGWDPDEDMGVFHGDVVAAPPV